MIASPAIRRRIEPAPTRAWGIAGLWVCLFLGAQLAAGADAIPGHPARPAEAKMNVAATAPPPAPSIPPSQLDSQPIGGRRSADSTAPAVPEDHPQDLGMTRVVVALGAVIGLILLLRLAGKRFFQSPSIGRSTRAVQILARSVIAPRREVLLIRVGRRIIVVGESGAQMSPLGEISDPDEVAALVGQIQNERSESAARAFGNLFHHASQEMSGEEIAAADESESPEMPDPATAETAVDPFISETRDELSGLSERIRGLSQLFPRS